MVDKYFFIKGGAERYFFELKKVLEQKGHEVIPFSMQHPENFESPYASDFVANIEFNGLTWPEKIKRAPSIVSRVIYSRMAQKKLTGIIEKVKPDIAHLHMIDHQLSPSILHTLRDYQIPVVQTCHQYKLVCPSYRLFIMHKNEICERCVAGNFANAIIQRCHKKSFAASTLVAMESFIHRKMRIYDYIDAFHVPSRFLGEKLIEGGFPREKIWHSFYTINLADYPYHPKSDNYFVFLGRLSEEKGVLTLLKAMNLVPQAKLKILGDGPQRALLESYAREDELANVEFCGNLGGDALVKMVQNARFIVVPSEWYDNSPLVIYESFSMGKPAIVSTMGGMPELVDDGHNGYHFTAGNVNELARRIEHLWDNRRLCEKLGANARAKAEAEFSPEAHYKKIMSLYANLLSRKKLPEELRPEHLGMTTEAG